MWLKNFNTSHDACLGGEKKLTISTISYKG